MEEEIIEIEIQNWEKYDPKRNQKTYTWARIDNDIADSQDLFGLDYTDRYVWVVIQCQASKKGCGKFFFNLDWFTTVSGIPMEKIKSSLLKLGKKNLIGKNKNQLDLPPEATNPPSHNIAPADSAEDAGVTTEPQTNATPTNGRTDVTNGRTDEVLKKLRFEIFENSPQQEKPTFIVGVS